MRNYTDFWTRGRLGSMFNSSDNRSSDSNDAMQYASILRAIGNFVSIVTGDSSIKVNYHAEDSSYTDGKTVTISAIATSTKDFDSIVGLALHEGSHCKLTDFGVLRNLINNPVRVIPNKLVQIVANKNKSSNDDARKVILARVKDINNVIEDRRIDRHTYDDAPGYRGYYKSLYAKYFNSKMVTKMLQSDNYRDETYQSYMSRIINFTNKDRDLDATKSLREIWDLVDIKNIDRFKNTQDTMDIAFEVYEIIANAIDPEDSPPETKPEEGDGESGEGNGNPIDGHAKPGEGNGTELTQKELKQLLDALEKQNKYNKGEVKKEALSGKTKEKVDAIIQTSTDIVTTGGNNDPGETSKNYNAKGGGGKHGGNSVGKTDTIVVKKLTKQFIDADPFSLFRRSYNSTSNNEYVKTGLQIGTMLGRKLQLRNDERSTKFNRLKKGKIDKRMIPQCGFGNTSVFCQTETDAFSPAIVHLSIDGSGSMSGTKWSNTMIAVVAICKAASLVSNLDVTVNYRYTTSSGGGGGCPLVLVAYDSRQDKISKVQHLFQYLDVCGTTPEGLCFEAIRKTIDVAHNKGTDSYFINFSDGSPGFSNRQMSYSGHMALTHTRNEVTKLRKDGHEILSFFIADGYDDMSDFREMYGKAAKEINVTEIVPLARELNKLFASKAF